MTPSERACGKARAQALAAMAPEAGIEPATDRLIPTSRDSTAEQIFPDPFGRLHRFDLFFTFHRIGAGIVWLAPDEFPWSVLVRVFSFAGLG